MNFIMTDDKTLASVLISEGYHPISSNDNKFVFEKTDEILKICLTRFDESKFVFTNTIFL